MGERVTTEQARAILAAAMPTADDLRLVHSDGTPIGCTYSEGDKCRTCGGAAMVDLNEWGEHLDGCAAAAIEARVKPARRDLAAAAPDIAADLIDARAEIDTLTKQRDNAFGYVESIEGALNGAGVQDWIEHWSGHPEEPPSAEQADPLSRVMMLVEERDALKRDIIAARERIAALEAERDATRELRGVPVEEHARAVREAWTVFCRPLYADRGRAASDADIAEHWRECDTRTRLIARLVGSGLTEAQAVALADGVTP